VQPPIPKAKLTRLIESTNWIHVTNPDMALCSSFDVLLMDLDGVVYIGSNAVAFAAQALEQCSAQFGVQIVYVTNNASRTPADVVDVLASVGVSAEQEQIVTSAQVAAARLAQELDAGQPVLVVGGSGLEVALRAVGLTPVRSLEDNPVAVVQGFHPDIGWRDLAQAAGALHNGLPWVASNADMTLPTELGIAPGNGALIGALAAAVGRYPEVVGKPNSPALVEAVTRTSAQRPLVVGDRLDTDIEAAFAAGYPSLLVLTGVTDVAQVCQAIVKHRPTYICRDLRGLLHTYVAPVSEGRSVRIGGWELELGVDDVAVISRGVDLMQGVRAIATASWQQSDAGRDVGVHACELIEQLQRDLRDDVAR
jgi:glycerol 3-phosphatase-2